MITIHYQCKVKNIRIIRYNLKRRKYVFNNQVVLCLKKVLSSNTDVRSIIMYKLLLAQDKKSSVLEKKITLECSKRSVHSLTLSDHNC